MFSSAKTDLSETPGQRSKKRWNTHIADCRRYNSIYGHWFLSGMEFRWMNCRKWRHGVVPKRSDGMLLSLHKNWKKKYRLWTMFCVNLSRFCDSGKRKSTSEKMCFFKYCLVGCERLERSTYGLRVRSSTNWANNPTGMKLYQQNRNRLIPVARILFFDVFSTHLWFYLRRLSHGISEWVL